MFLRQKANLLNVKAEEVGIIGENAGNKVKWIQMSLQCSLEVTPGQVGELR